MPVVAGVLASRERTALLLGTTPDRLAFDLLDALDRPVPPVVVAPAEAPCQEVVIRPPFDLRTPHPGHDQHRARRRPVLQHGPAARRGPRDRRVRRHHPPHVRQRPGHDERELHRAGRHIDQFRAEGEGAGKPLPVSVSIGLDPAIYVATSFEAPTTPLGFDELTIAGGLRGRPVELVECVTVAGQGHRARRDRARGRVLCRASASRGRADRHGLGHARVPRLRRPRPAGPAGAPRDRGHPPPRPDPPDPRRARRGARHPGRAADRGQHPPAGRGRHARLPAERLLPSRPAAASTWPSCRCASASPRTRAGSGRPR